MNRPLTTILGKLSDTTAYLDRPGYNVSPPSDDWTPELGRAWLVEAVNRGDKFELVSTDFSGMYLREIHWLQAEAQRLRLEAIALQDRALELGNAIARVSKEAIGASILEPVRKQSQVVEKEPLDRENQ